MEAEDKFDFKKYSATNIEWEFEVDGMKFSCEETNLGEEVDFFNHYIEPDGRENIAKLRMVQCTKLKKTPFTSEWITYIFNTFYPNIQVFPALEAISWDKLDLNHRLLFLRKLDPKFMSKIMKCISDHYEGKEVIAKN